MQLAPGWRASIGFGFKSSRHPLRDSAVPLSLSRKRKIGMANSDAPLVLCVDGEIAALQVRSLLLSSAGYRVVTARNGGDALQVLRLNPVSLVIIDLWQPECTGMNVAAEMKRIRPEIPVILLSGLMDAPAGAEQADLVLTKGISPQEFLKAIRAVLGRGEDETNSDERAS